MTEGRSPRETHGPLVKTGPTAGQNRSRNNDGTWRKSVVMQERVENKLRTAIFEKR